MRRLVTAFLLVPGAFSTPRGGPPERGRVARTDEGFYIAYVLEGQGAARAVAAAREA
jgi:hypothetical protein